MMNMIVRRAPRDAAMAAARCICGCSPDTVTELESHANGTEFLVTFHCGTRATFAWHKKPVLYGVTRSGQ